jgi:ribonucleoside-diphosphate reductase beta chain
MKTTYTIPRTFVLDQDGARAALAAKRVVGGRETMTFNLSRCGTAGPTSCTGR